MKVYKLRNKNDGTFSLGGTKIYRIWSKSGKTWNRIGDIRCHINLFKSEIDRQEDADPDWKKNLNKKYQDYLNSAEIVVFEINEVETIEV